MKTPNSIYEAFTYIIWKNKYRNVLVLLLIFMMSAFAIWSSLPNKTKISLIENQNIIISSIQVDEKDSFYRKDRSKLSNPEAITFMPTLPASILSLASHNKDITLQNIRCRFDERAKQIPYNDYSLEKMDHGIELIFSNLIRHRECENFFKKYKNKKLPDVLIFKDLILDFTLFNKDTNNHVLSKVIVEISVYGTQIGAGPPAPDPSPAIKVAHRYELDISELVQQIQSFYGPNTLLGRLRFPVSHRDLLIPLDEEKSSNPRFNTSINNLPVFTKDLDPPLLIKANSPIRFQLRLPSDPNSVYQYFEVYFTFEFAGKSHVRTPLIAFSYAL